MQIATLRKIDPAQRMARFYAISVHPTLFGDYAVVLRWGRVATDGRRREHWRATAIEAVSLAIEQAERKRRRGYADVVQPASPWSSHAETTPPTI